MSETITNLIPEEAWAILVAEPSTSEYERAAALTIAAELDRQADRIEDSAKAWDNPRPGTAAYSMAGVLTDVVVELRMRAAELRGDRKETGR